MGQFWGKILGPILGLGAAFFGDPKFAMAGVAIWMSIWWMSEAVPMAITAFLPIVLFPSLGIMSGEAAASLYFNHITFLLVGSFIVTLGMERWNLHRRIALRLLLLFGNSPGKMLAAAIISTTFLSMWISNTATTMMMMPIFLAVIVKMEEDGGDRLGKGMLLGVAYGASIGGMSTLVGTPPNLSFLRILTINFPDVTEISFSSWWFLAFPLVVCMLCAAWLLIYHMFDLKNIQGNIDFTLIRRRYKALGPMSFAEKVILADFLILVLLWVFRSPIKLGNWSMPGWYQLFETGPLLTDGSVAIAMALILFLIPSRTGKGSIVEWNTISALPWNIIILLGGGFALASGFIESGLSLWCAGKLKAMGNFHPVILIFSICFIMTFMTEVTAIMSTVEIFLPILASLAVSAQINPLFLMIAATLACSCAFTLPVATPSNMIVFGTNRLSAKDMIQTGIWMNIFGFIFITLTMIYIAPIVLDISWDEMPAWAVQR